MIKKHIENLDKMIGYFLKKYFEYENFFRAFARYMGIS